MVRGGSNNRFNSISGSSSAAARTRTYVVAAVTVVLVTLVVLHAVGTSHFWSLTHGSGGAARKVEKHFFFELLPSFDVDETGHRAVVPSLSASAPGGASLFTGIMDRVLFTRYLVERFAFSSFLQLGCAGSSSSHVYQLLPDTAVPTRVCVDAGASRVVSYTWDGLLRRPHGRSPLSPSPPFVPPVGRVWQTTGLCAPRYPTTSTRPPRRRYEVHLQCATPR